MLVTSIRPGLGGVDDQAGDRRNLDCASGSLAGVIWSGSIRTSRSSGPRSGGC